MSADDLYDTGASPWTPLPNEILEGLARVQLRSNEARVIACIIRKTFGFHAEGHPTNIRKARDRISLSQIGRATGLERRRAHGAVSSLGKRHIISVRDGKDRQPKSYGINMDIAQWSLSLLGRTEGKKSTRYKSILSGADRLSHAPRTALSTAPGTNLSPPVAHTKESERKPKEFFKGRAGPLASNGAKARPSEGSDQASRSPETGTPEYEKRMQQRKQVLYEQKKILESNIQNLEAVG
jgi:phage replication O-like protein O